MSIQFDHFIQLKADVNHLHRKICDLLMEEEQLLKEVAVQAEFNKKLISELNWLQVVRRFQTVMWNVTIFTLFWLTAACFQDWIYVIWDNQKHSLIEPLNSAPFYFDRIKALLGLYKSFNLSSSINRHFLISIVAGICNVGSIALLPTVRSRIQQLSQKLLP